MSWCVSMTARLHLINYKSWKQAYSPSSLAPPQVQIHFSLLSHHKFSSIFPFLYMKIVFLAWKIKNWITLFLFLHMKWASLSSLLIYYLLAPSPILFFVWPFFSSFVFSRSAYWTNVKPKWVWALWLSVRHYIYWPSCSLFSSTTYLLCHLTKHFCVVIQNTQIHVKIITKPTNLKF